MTLAKCLSLDKMKSRLQCDIGELLVEVEKANQSAASMEKKQKVFDKLISEWRQKCEDLTMELECSQKESRQFSVESFKVRAQYEESVQVVNSVRRENENLAEEIRDLMEQLSVGGRNVHELEKLVKRIEMEREELVGVVDEVSGQLEQAEAKFLMAQMECANVRAEIER